MLFHSFGQTMEVPRDAYGTNDIHILFTDNNQTIVSTGLNSQPRLIYVDELIQLHKLQIN